MKSLVLFATFFLFTQIANAQGVSGKWVGWGEWLYEGSGTECNMTITYDVSEKKVNRVSGKFDCGIVLLHSGPGEWIRQGNDLYIGDVKEGSYDGTTLETWETIDDGVRVQTTITSEGEKITYKELWFGKAGNLIYEIHGRMARQSSTH